MPIWSKNYTTNIKFAIKLLVASQPGCDPNIVTNDGISMEVNQFLRRFIMGKQRHGKPFNQRMDGSDVCVSSDPLDGNLYRKKNMQPASIVGYLSQYYSSISQKLAKAVTCKEYEDCGLSSCAHMCREAMTNFLYQTDIVLFRSGKAIIEEHAITDAEREFIEYLSTTSNMLIFQSEEISRLVEEMLNASDKTSTIDVELKSLIIHINDLWIQMQKLKTILHLTANTNITPAQILLLLYT